MIKNDKQLTITKRKAKEFEAAIQNMKNEGIHPLLFQAQINALKLQHDELISEIEDYEQVKSGSYAVFDVKNISELPKALIRSRVYLGLTQLDLAQKLGMKEQQVQRYENTEYASASFSTILSVVDALDLKITEGVFLPEASREKNLLLEKLNDAGLDPAFIEKRISPRDINKLDISLWVDKVSERVSEIFGWSKHQLLSDNPLSIGRDGSLVARFKMPAGARLEYASAYTQYAYSLAKILAQYHLNSPKPISSSPEKVRNEILQKYGSLKFENILKFANEHGVVVVGLNDSGAFHGATWRINFKNVVVLKQKSSHCSKWAFDLLHELYHTSQHPELSEFSLIELSETSDERRTAQEEIEANDFASKVLLGSRSEEYINMCFSYAKGKISWLKNAVIQVAQQEKLDCGILAYQVVNKHEELQRKEGKHSTWWGTAHNLQSDEDNPRELCIKILKENISINSMSDFEREFYEQAVAS
ncbi:helix-turn-helix domain-containing protein [Pantoea sp. Seng]|uniref:XRE family transcriptional regulator n=1 Tax=Pantoea sp. Seng TaxID=2576761 RepID=UPI001324840C|nr:XRE family transcriptional regulator [Pantoea sp. Seng]MXP54226.1 helix-turn-helix domain-containing protein [Pantoea sp. Seng]